MDVVCAVNYMFTDINEEGNKPISLPAPRRLWKPPDKDFLKINFNAGFRKKDGVGTCGFVVRNQWEKQYWQMLQRSCHFTMLSQQKLLLAYLR